MALDVYLAEGTRAKLLELRCSLTDLHAVLPAGLLVELLFDDILRPMRFEEFTACFIVVEGELISQKAQCDTNVTVDCQRITAESMRLVYSRSRHVSESSESLTLDEQVHQVTTQVLCLEIQAEESMVITKS